MTTTEHLGLSASTETPYADFDENFNLSKLANISDSKPVDGPQIIEPLRILYILLGSLGVFGNFFVFMILIIYSDTKRKITNKLIINQNAADLLASLMVLFSALFQPVDTGLDKNNMAHKVVCTIWMSGKFPLWGLIVVSVYSMLAVTFERYLSVVHPVFHRKHLGRGKSLTCLLLILPWFIALGYVGSVNPALMGIVDGTCEMYAVVQSVKVKQFIAMLTFIVEYPIPLFSMTYCYCHMIYVLRSKALAGVHSQNTKKVTLRIMGEKIISIRRFFNAVNSERNKVLADNTGKQIESSKLQQTSTGRSVSTDVSLAKNSKKVNSPNSSERTGMDLLKLPGQNIPKTISKEKSRTLSEKARINVIKTLLMVGVCFIVCDTWNQIYFLIFAVDNTLSLTSPFYNFTVVMILSNCIINPYIYTAKYRDFRNGLRRAVYRITGVLLCGKIRNNRIQPSFAVTDQFTLY